VFVADSVVRNVLIDCIYSELRKLEMLYELNVSTNQLSCLPASLNQLPKLVILRAHSNYLRSLPDFRQAKALRVRLMSCPTKKLLIK